MTGAPMNATTAPVEAQISAAPKIPGLSRLVSLDAYRGLVMLLMMAEVLHFSRVARAFPDSGFWAFLASQQSHRAWIGCSLHDLIQPSFTFLVGVALPFSIASRLAKGQSFGKMLWHAAWRSFLLIWLGIFLRSVGASQTNFTFEDTLTQIGLGYTFVFLLAFARPRAQWIALAVILIGYWAAFALYPPPGPNFDWHAAGVAADWPHLGGFAAHWDKNSNFAAAFEVWFLNLFPRENPFLYNGGGYVTLSFIPTLGTMLFGLLAGQWLRGDKLPAQKLMKLITAGLVCISLAAAIHFIGLCPIVKRIWTPSWTIFSAGWAFLFLASFYAIIDLKGHRRWSFPLVVIGMNSIAAYCMAHLIDRFILSSFKTHFGQGVFEIFGEAYEPLVSGSVLLLAFWLILYWMYRRQLFLRI
jgi:heparan-alpha-glucosaminide N-acetyltransferase